MNVDAKSKKFIEGIFLLSHLREHTASKHGSMKDTVA